MSKKAEATDMGKDVLARIVETEAGQGGKELASLSGFDIPVKIGGTFSAPTFKVDESFIKNIIEQKAKAALDKEKAKIKEAVEQEMVKAKETVEEEKAKIKEQVEQKEEDIKKKIEEDVKKKLEKLFR